MHIDAHDTDPAAIELQRLYRKSLIIVVFSQILGGLGLSAGVSVGALLAQEMLDSTGLSGLPGAMFTLGSAGSALMLGGCRSGLGGGPASVSVTWPALSAAWV